MVQPARVRRTFGRDDSPRPPAPRPRVVGVTGTSIHAGRITDLDQNTEVRGERWIGSPGRLGFSDQMIRDPVVYRSHQTVVSPLVDAFWDVDAASRDRLDVEIADFVCYNLFERISWSRFTEQWVSAVLKYACACFEQTDEMQRIPQKRFPNHPGRGQGLVLTGLHHRPAPTIQEWIPRADNAAQLARIVQWGGGNDVETAGSVEVSADRLVRFTWAQDGANFLGYAPSRPQYGPWKAKRLTLVLLMIAQERFAVPMPVVTLPENQQLQGAPAEDEVEEVEKILRDYRSSDRGYITLPGGYKLDLKNVDAATAILKALEDFDDQILFPFAAGYEKLGQKSSGSHALAGTQKSTQEIELARYATFGADVINLGTDGWSLVERIVRANYGRDVALPRLVARSLPTRDWSKVLPLVRNLGEIGFLTPGRITEEFLRDITTLPQETEPYVEPGTRAKVAAAAKPEKDDEPEPKRETAE